MLARAIILFFSLISVLPLSFRVGADAKGASSGGAPEGWVKAIPLTRVPDDPILPEADAADAGTPPPGYALWKSVQAKVTAYEPTEVSCGNSADGRTSIGRNAWRTDGVAADPRAIPYGAIVWIPEIGFRKVDDTGGAMRQSWERRRVYHLDVRMTYVHQARKWGVRHLPVCIYLPVRATEI
jgi:3D (Asp-Asp-Asp) domain-containing protein